MRKSADNVVRVNPRSPLRRLIQQAATVLRRGGIVAFPTETVYGLGAHALDRAAVKKIFAAKQRPDWDPLIVHVRDIAMARSLAKTLPATFEMLAAKFWPGPLTFVVEKADCVPHEVTAGRPTVALRMPRHPVATMLLAELGLPIAAPSANRFGRPSPTRAEHVVADLGDSVDLILDAGPTPVGVESTVLDLTQLPPAILRPGGVSREELEAVIGPVAVAPGVPDQVAAKKGLSAPGMSVTHYAPRAAVELFEGELHEVGQRLVGRLAALHARGTRVGALVCEEMLCAAEQHTDYVACFGKWGEWDRLAQRLFAALRALDAQSVAVILCVLPPAAGVGLAVRDRLQRAAGVRTVTA
jgi:L-threonylcarbamoyladenylate synthase